MSAISSYPNFFNSTDLLTNVLNSKLASSMYNAVQGQSSIPVPDNTRRSFVASMEADARVARQGAQNMLDAEGMLTIAQSNITAAKDSLQQMRTLTNELRTIQNVSPEQYIDYSNRLKDYANNITGIMNGAEFNGYKLLDGSNPTFNITGGGMSVDAEMPDLLAPSIAVFGENNENLDVDKINTSDGVNSLIESIDSLISSATHAEASLSIEIKGVSNLATLLESQADVYDAVRKNHIDTDGDDTDDENDTPTSNEILQALLQGSLSSGNIITGSS